MSARRKAALRIEDLARQLDLPAPYTAKILQRLRAGGFVTSHRGRHGGFRLARDPSRLPLLEVVHFLDGEGAIRECLMGRDACSADNACPLHTYWSRIKQTREEMLRGVVVAALTGGRREQPAPRSRRGKPPRS